MQFNYIFLFFLIVTFLSLTFEKELDVVPVYLGSVKLNQGEVTLQTTSPTAKNALCFQKMVATLTGNQKGGTLKIVATEAKSLMCSDLLFVTVDTLWNLDYIFRKGKHTFSMKFKNGTKQWEMAQKIGVQIMVIKKNIITDMYHLFHLYEAWYKNDPKYIKTVLQDQLEFKYPQRSVGAIYLNDSYIQDGDGLAIAKFNHEEAGIMMGSGSRAGHSAVFLRDPDTKILYVIEATPDFGFHKTEWKLWLKLHSNGSRCKPEHCHAVHLPLKREYSNIFDSRGAWNFYKKMEGQEYTYHANFFSPLDKKDDCAPAPFNCNQFTLVLFLLDKFYPDTFRNYFLMGIEQRLNRKFNNFVEFSDYVAQHNMTVSEVLAIPEQDDWLYNGKPSLQCTSLVIRMYKSAGLFDYIFKKPRGYSEKVINAAEFHPRDMYQLSVYDKNDRASYKPKQCYDGYHDKDSTCQVLGYNVMELPFYATVPVYEHMNEKCPLIYPFDHTQKC